MSETTSVVLVGVGGQGILLASEIVARAAMADGLQVKTNEVHGMAQRGGSVIAQIRFGQEVFSPIVPVGSATVLGALERVEALRYAQYLAPGGLCVASTQAIVPVTVSQGLAAYPGDVQDRLEATFSRLLYVPAQELALQAGSDRAANTVILGALSGSLPLSPESWNRAIEHAVKPRFVEINKEAFHLGRAHSTESVASS